MLDRSKFVRLHYQKRAFGHCQCVNGNIASNEKFTPDNATVSIDFDAIIAHQMLEPIRWHEIADLFLDFSHYALQIAFVTFAVPTKKTHLAWL